MDKAIDINCDMGEGFDENEKQIMPYITSANISCGYHAGTEVSIQKTIALAIKYGVKLGAHPSYLDLENFGRTNQNLSEKAIYQLVKEQLELMTDWLKTYGTKLHHVKLHGALYNQTAKNFALANAAVQAIYEVDKSLLFYGLAGSQHLIAAKEIGVLAMSEVFSDRSYEPDGSLTPRSQKNALLTDIDAIHEQVVRMIDKQEVVATDGSIIKIKADTICIHGDGNQAVEIAKKIGATFLSSR